jgi:hypothetical protein
MSCCDHDCHAPNADARYRRILWAALGVKYHDVRYRNRRQLGLHQVAFCLARRRRMYSAMTAL